MTKIRLMLDAASDLPFEQAKALDIELLTALVSFDGKEQPEREMDKKEYIRYLSSCDEIPTTSAVSPMQLMDAFERAKEDGVTDVIVVTISSTGSALFNNCFLAKDMFEEKYGAGVLNFTFIDSRTYTFCYGDAVAKAAKMALEGASVSEIVSYLEDTLSRVMGVAGVYSLKYARKSGRISGTAAFVGEMMGLKPILLVDDGKVNIVDKARGEAAIFPKMIEVAKKHIADSKNQDIKIFIGDIPDKDVENLKALLRHEFAPRSISVGILGPSLTTNAGPKVCGFTFMAEKHNSIEIK